MSVSFSRVAFRFSLISSRALSRAKNQAIINRRLFNTKPPESSGGKKVSTVSSGSDNGANDCMANRFGSMRHDTTERSITNLLSKLQPAILDAQRRIGISEEGFTLGKGQPLICGHGDDGFLTTGAGQNDQQTYQNTMGTWNEFSWGPHFDKLKDRNYVILTVLSCNTGAGEDGADLLYSIAQRTNHTVRARTGLTSCGSGGITFQEGSTWQVATPTQRPNPIPAPSHFRKLSSAEIKFKDEGGIKTISNAEIKKVKVSKVSPYTSSQSEVVLEREGVEALLKNIDFNPARFGTGKRDALLGIITARIKVFIDSNGKTKEFLVYNNSVLQDSEYPEIYYSVLPGFKGLINKLL